MKTKAKMPKRTQHCDTEKAKHCDKTANLAQFLASKHPPQLLERDLETCHTAQSTVTNTGSGRLTPKTVSTVTDECVTVLIRNISDEYYGILMNKKIEAIWLTIERMAEIKGCSNRTVWRYIDKHKMHTEKRQVKIGSAKVIKTFVLPDPETLELEFSICSRQRLIPEEYLETVIPTGKRMVKSLLVYGYTKVMDSGGVA